MQRGVFGLTSLHSAPPYPSLHAWLHSTASLVNLRLSGSFSGRMIATDVTSFRNFSHNRTRSLRFSTVFVSPQPSHMNC